jgi:tetratricopeptide (TPR) repeat protein
VSIPEHYSSLIHQYLKKYQEDPQSKIFAPLAEAYRKAGLTDEAIEIAQEGILIHPHYIGGKVALSRALFDKKEYDKVIHVLEDVLENAPDNIIALKLNAESYLMLGRINEALYHFKLLLYYTPQDNELYTLVKELESEALESGEQQVIENKQINTVLQNKENLNKQKTSKLEFLEWKKRIQRAQELLLRVESYRQRNIIEF